MTKIGTTCDVSTAECFSQRMGPDVFPCGGTIIIPMIQPCGMSMSWVNCTKMSFPNQKMLFHKIYLKYSDLLTGVNCTSGVFNNEKNYVSNLFTCVFH